MKGAKQVKNVVDANDKARDEVTRKKLADIEALPVGGELSAADAEGSAKESTVPGGAGPPALSTLDDVVMEPDVAASGQARGAEGEGAAVPRLTVEQNGAEIRRVCMEAAVADQQAAALAAIAAGPAAATVPGVRRGAPEGTNGREGQGIGCGVFDAMYTPAEGDLPFSRYGRKYKSSNEWSAVAEQQYEKMLADLVVGAAALGLGQTVRLFKVAWQGNELSRDAIVQVLQQVMAPAGEVQGTLGVLSELFDNGGVRANGGEAVLGRGGGIYVPMIMKHLNVVGEKDAEHLKLWGGVRPGYSDDSGPGGADEVTQLWDCPAGYFTVGVPMLMGDGREVVHNLCIEMSWWTLETTQEPEKLGCLRGEWRIPGVDVRKREETQVVRLARSLEKLGDEYRGIKMQLRQEWVNGVKLQMIWGVSPSGMRRQAEQVAGKLPFGVYIEWLGEQRLLQTGKPDLLIAEKGQWGKAGGATSISQMREEENPRKLVIKPLAKHLQGPVWGGKLQEALEGCGFDGVQSVGFSEDRSPGYRRRGVVAFVVFETPEQRDAVLETDKVIWALFTPDFQCENKRIELKAADTEWSSAQVGGRKDAGGSKSKRTRSETIVVPKPNRLGIGGGQVRGRDSGGGSGPTIMDENTGKVMDRGGEEAIKKMEQEASDKLVKKMGEQMNQMFASLAVKQEVENSRLKEENQQMQRQLVEQNNRIEQQSNMMDQRSDRMEQMMGMLMRQMGMEQPGSPPEYQPAVVTPVKGSRVAVVVPPLPGAGGPSSMVKKARSAVEPGQQGTEAIAEMARHNQAMKEARLATDPNFGQLDAEEVAEMVRRNQVMKKALQDCMEQGAGMTQFMQQRGHHEVVGMIESGGVSPPEAK